MHGNFYGSSLEMAPIASVLIPLFRAQSQGIRFTARTLGSVPSSNLVGDVPEGSLMVSISEQGEWLSVLREERAAVHCLGLGWEGAL